MTSTHWPRLNNTALAYHLAKQADRPCLVVLPDVASADNVYQALRFFAPAQCPILSFPDWETLPYDSFSPHADLVSRRLKTLTQLPNLSQGILVVAAQSLMGRLAPLDYIGQHSFCIATGENIDPIALRQKLASYGYSVTEQVSEAGQVCLRGSLLDVFPSGSKAPLRIEFFDQDIEQIRYFDPESQLTTGSTDRIEVLPAHEFPLNESGIAYFRERWRTHFDGDPTLSPIYQSISQHQQPQGIEYYLPLFFEHTATLFDFLPKNYQVFYQQDCAAHLQAFWQQVQQRYQQQQGLIHQPPLPPEQLYLSDATCVKLLKHGQRFGGKINDTLPISGIEDLPEFLQTSAKRCILTATTEGRLSAVANQCQQQGLTTFIGNNWAGCVANPSILQLCQAPITQSFITDDLIVICEAALRGARVETTHQPRQDKRRHAPGITIQQFTELHPGDYVVHETHGIACFMGLKTLVSQDRAQEFMLLQYANDDKLYIPIHDLNVITRYIGTEDTLPALTKLGSGAWEKAREKAYKRAFDTAAELLEVNAKRQATPGFSYPQPDQDYQTFSHAFPFETTVDQQRAIDDILKDMALGRAMDRLVCGDVGFGKTEVAMRAAFLAVHSHKQVAVLAPTTLLASQHLQSFEDRFAAWPVNIGLLSRLVEGKRLQQTLDDLSSGKIDIIIGTHKILQKTVQFKNLGLLIVDEEHRFGVTHKEHIKAMCANVDILTLTATPIPRTLNFALSEMRDLSLITTPPARRLAVKTFVNQFNDQTIKEAIQREIRRGGQVFFLHNQVENIQAFAKHIQSLLPEATLDVAHGQMPKRQLEQTMLSFYHQEFQVLICTTIIESGIDIPSANTILIDRADKLGLAQLHQLRGRVGRSHHQAYAYLLTPEPAYLSADAKKRLEVIAKSESLGAGFNLAVHDLEIRGAGQLLGNQQSGHMQAVGFECYISMLKRAVESLKEGKILNTDASSFQTPTGTEIDCGLSARIPEEYIQDIQCRLGFYKRIANASGTQAFEQLQYELKDRFGPLPNDVIQLLQITQLRNLIQPLGVKKLTARQGEARIHLAATNQLDQKQLIKLIQIRPQSFKLKPPNQVILSFDEPHPNQRLGQIHQMLGQLFSSKISLANGTKA